MEKTLIDLVTGMEFLVTAGYCFKYKTKKKTTRTVLFIILTSNT